MSAVPGRRAPSPEMGVVLRGAPWYIPIAVAALVSARWGVGSRSFIFLGLLIAITLIPLPSWFWAAGALGVALLMRTLTATGVLPTIMNFADFGFVYVGLAAVLIRRGALYGKDARRLGRALLLLLAATWASWLFNPSDLVRPFFTFVLWAEPFVFVLILLAEPPGPTQQRGLLKWFALLIALQIPFSIYQAVTIGLGDPVKGTLIDSGAGAHVLCGVAALAALALTTWGFSRSFALGIGATVLAAPLLIALPILADAKQVMFVLPLAGVVLFITARGAATKLALIVPPIVALIVLIWFVPAGKTALIFLQEAEKGRSGKLVGLEVLRNELGASFAGWSFGLGPANGLSRAAYLTDPTFSRKGSPILLLHLEPAPLPPLVDAEAARVAGGSSFNLPLSSAVGVLSDVGVVGLAAFAALIGSVMLPLWRRRRTWLAQVALAGWVMSVPLALTFDWWEEPPFMLSLALLTALALLWSPRATPTGPPVRGGLPIQTQRGGNVDLDRT